MRFAGEVWQTLSKIDVSHKVEKKGNLSYLSWAWAWGVLMEHYPGSLYEFKEPTFMPDGTCEMWVTVTVRGKDACLSREMWLPVMDNRNKSIVAPTSRDISDTRMRCLTKCLAMFGLGHYIYAGEDLPEAGSISVPRSYTAAEKGILDSHIENQDPTRFLHWWAGLDDAKKNDLYNSFEKGQITRKKEILSTLERKGREKIHDIVVALREAINNNDDAGILEIKEELESHEKKLVAEHLSKDEIKRLVEVK